MAARRRFLPPIGSPGYHLLLATVAIFVLGPLGGITSAYMNFSLGFFVGGQVLAGILGSVVTYGYAVGRTAKVGKLLVDCIRPRIRATPSGSCER